MTCTMQEAIATVYAPFVSYVVGATTNTKPCNVELYRIFVIKIM